MVDSMTRIPGSGGTMTQLAWSPDYHEGGTNSDQEFSKCYNIIYSPGCVNSLWWKQTEGLDTKEKI